MYGVEVGGGVCSSCYCVEVGGGVGSSCYCVEVGGGVGSSCYCVEVEFGLVWFGSVLRSEVEYASSLWTGWNTPGHILFDNHYYGHYFLSPE